MDILLPVHLLHPMYQFACFDECNAPRNRNLGVSFTIDFINMYDGCAFE